MQHIVRLTAEDLDTGVITLESYKYRFNEKSGLRLRLYLKVSDELQKVVDCKIIKATFKLNLSGGSCISNTYCNMLGYDKTEDNSYKACDSFTIAQRHFLCDTDKIVWCDNKLKYILESIALQLYCNELHIDLPDGDGKISLDEIYGDYTEAGITTGNVTRAKDLSKTYYDRYSHLTCRGKDDNIYEDTTEEYEETYEDDIEFVEV